MFCSRARGLEETPCAGRRRAAGFPVPGFLLPLLNWTRSRTTSIHRTCVIPRRRCSCGAGLYRLVRLYDLDVGFGCLHRQHSCGNVPAHSVFKGMNTTSTPFPFNYIDRSCEKVCRKKIVFCCEPQQQQLLHRCTHIIHSTHVHLDLIKHIYACLYPCIYKARVYSLI
jgi:hypothetical protein